MKKMTKVSLIIALVLLLVGGVLFVTGIAMGADFPLRDRDDDWTMDENTAKDMLNETPKSQFEYKAADVKELEINVERAYLKISDSKNSDSILVKTYTDKDRVEFEKDEQKLTIERDEKWHDMDKYPIQIEIPSSMRFIEAQIGVGRGVLELDSIQAENLEIDTGMATATIYGSAKASNADLNVGMGTLEAAMLEAKSCEINVGMGSADVKMTGTQNDYYSTVDCGMGSVTVGGESYSGIAVGSHGETESFETNQNVLDIECGMGTVTVSFEK